MRNDQQRRPTKKLILLTWIGIPLANSIFYGMFYLGLLLSEHQGVVAVICCVVAVALHFSLLCAIKADNSPEQEKNAVISGVLIPSLSGIALIPLFGMLGALFF